MSKSQDASLQGAIARCGKLLGLGALASLLVLSAAHAQTKGETPTPDTRGLRLVTLAPIPPPRTTARAARCIRLISAMWIRPPETTISPTDPTGSSILSTQSAVM